jgi:zinc protease
MSSAIRQSIRRKPSYWVIAVGLVSASSIATPAWAEDAPVAAEAPAAAEKPSGPDIWGIDAGDLKPDPTIRYGILPNGMRYALQPNPAQSYTASVRFVFDVGKADENDGERGYAHFVEHMAFNGSKQIPEGELIKKLERLGLAFGADTNAETSVDYTNYKLELPQNNDETVDAALLMMRELASELTITQEAVKAESGVIAAEESTREGAFRRRATEFVQLAMPGTRVGDRITNGDGKDVRNATAASLRAFYEGHYRPERATLIITGGIDADAIEQKIVKSFSGWKGTGPARPKYAPVINADRPIAIGNFVDPSNTGSAEIYRIYPLTKMVNSDAGQLKVLNEAVAQIILSTRFAKLPIAPDARILQAVPLQQDLFRMAGSTGALAVGKNDNWQGALQILEQEMRKARTFGFTESEVKNALDASTNALRNLNAQESSRNGADLADALAKSALDGTVIQTPSEGFANFERLAAQINAESVTAAYRAAWGNGINTIHIATKTPIADPEKAVAEIWSESAKIAVAAPVDTVAKAFAYSNFGKPGKVKSDKWSKDADVRLIRFANGTMLNLFPTDVEKGRIQFGLRVGSGMAGLPADKPGLGLMIDILSGEMGFGAHGFDEVQGFILGKSVALGLSSDIKAFAAAGTTTPTDLPLQLQLLTALVSDFGYRPESQSKWENLAPTFKANIVSNPQVVYLTAAPYILSSNDGRYGLSSADDLAARNIGELKQAIDAQLKTGALELALIGDIDEETAIDLVAATLGALPKRAAKFKLTPAQNFQNFPTDRSLRTLYHDGKADQGLIAIHWPTSDDSNLKSAMTRELLAQAVNMQLNDVVREKLGATYSPEAQSWASSDFAGYGYIYAIATASADKMDLIRDAVKEIARELRDAPISEDQLLRARKPISERYDRETGDNMAWVGPVGVAQSEPHRLPRRWARVDALNEVTAEDIHSAALQYLTDPAALEIRVVPRPAAPVASQ